MALKSASWSWGVPRHPDESGAGGGEADADEMDEEMEDETAEVSTLLTLYSMHYSVLEKT